MSASGLPLTAAMLRFCHLKMRARFLRTSVSAMVLTLAAPATARAQASMFPPVTSPDFNIDLFEQPALGSPRLIAMAGAVNSVSEGAAGLYTNPASAAVRPETKSDRFAWNVYFNSYIPVTGQDSNNNGQPVTRVRRSLLGAVGLLLQYGKWGLSLDAGYTAHEIAPEAGGGLGVRSVIPHVALARTFFDDHVALGAGLRGGALNVYTLDMRQTLFTRAGASADAGGVWKPRDTSFRLALSGALPVYTGALENNNCDPLNCYGYILPDEAIVPWDLILGGAWRFGPTPWNHAVDGIFRDERSLTVAADLHIMGAVERGYGMEAFAAKQLQPSGRNVSFTPRLGLETELIRGWLRLRAGSYREAARFAGTGARYHGTTGAEVRLFSFRLAGRERRVAFSAAADVARNYQNVALSIGFWN